MSTRITRKNHSQRNYENTEVTSTATLLERKAVETSESMAAGALLDRQIQLIAFDKLDLRDQSFQYRLEVEFDDLQHSLKVSGQHEPIDLLGGEPYRIIDGYRRVGALRALGAYNVAAIVHSSMSEESAHALAFLKNVVRKNLRPLERARAILMAKQRGSTTAQIATLLQLSSKQVSRYAALAVFPEEIQSLIADGILNIAHATVLARMPDANPIEWGKRVQTQAWSSTTLKDELRKSYGKRAQGRKCTYVRKEANVLRMYPFRIARDAPVAQRTHIIQVLRDAALFLETPVETF